MISPHSVGPRRRPFLTTPELLSVSMGHRLTFGIRTVDCTRVKTPFIHPEHRQSGFFKTLLRDNLKLLNITTELLDSHTFEQPSLSQVLRCQFSRLRRSSFVVGNWKRM